jgi:hypothetical protein
MASTTETKWLGPNTILAVVGFITSAAVFYASRDYPPAPLELGGAPGFYPRVLAVILACLSAAAFIEGRLRPLRASFPKGINLVRLLGVILLLATTPFAFTWLGFRLMGVLVALATMLLLSDWRNLNVRTFLLFAVIAVGVTFALHFVLETVARVPLPRGRIF